MKKYLFSLTLCFTLSVAACFAQPCSVTIHVDSNITCYGACNAGVVAKTTGTAPFFYNWDPGITSDSVATFLCAGRYIVTMTDDNGCIASDTVDIADPDLISTLPDIQNVTCTGLCNGTIKLNASGGIAPYTFAWDNGSTTEDLDSLCVGNFCVHIADANGCVYDDCNFFIIEPDPLTLDIQSLIGGTMIFCHGDMNASVLASIGGGSPPYTYDWSTGDTVELLNDLGAGTYVLTVTDTAGCSLTDSITFTQPDPFSVIYSTSDFNGWGVSCNGAADGFICASVSGQTLPYGFIWTPSGNVDSCETALGAGDYCVYISDANGCLTDTCITLTQADQLTDSPTYTDPTCTGCPDGTITVSAFGGVRPYTYAWTPNTNDVDSVATGLAQDIYSVCVTDANGCSVCDISVTLSDPLSAKNVEQNISLSISPNPTTGKFELLFKNTLNNASVRIFNPVGQLVYSDLFTSTAGSKKEINLNAPAGIYFIEISTEQSKWTGKIVKE